MKNYKATIIKKYGTPVQVKRLSSTEGDLEVIETKVLLGRGSTTRGNPETLENIKSGQFLPDFGIEIGDFVENKPHGEVYVVQSSHKEYDGSKTISVVTVMRKCNHSFYIRRNVEEADSRGNIKIIPQTLYADTPCSLEHITGDLRQYEPGLSPDAKYRLYTTNIDDVESTDQINVSGMSLKVVDVDYTTYPKLAVIQLSSDIRD